MNEMRKLMEAVNSIDIEIGDKYTHIESGATVKVYDLLRGGAYIEVKDRKGNTYTFTPREMDDQFTKSTTEAYQGGKTEHSGAKHGKGAYYGRKKDAKRDSNKNRRRAAKASASRPVELSLGEGEYGDYESGEDAVYDYGVVRVELRFSDREVTITHGHGENIFLHMDEWEEFVGELKDT